MEGNTPKLYTALLFLPVVGFFVPDEAINEAASFLVVLGLLAAAYLSYWVHPHNQFLNQIRKCLGCVATAALVLLLGAQVAHIFRVVYKLDFAEEMAFAVKMVLMLSNMEGNL
jgi:tellurite resistance protein TehA-like permease